MSYTCHSGGCAGADMMWENEGNKYGVTTIPYSFSGHVQDSPNPHILTPTELLEGWDNVLIAEQTLNRKVETITYNPYVRNLLCRNWFQVKNSTVIFAVGIFINKRRIEVSGGTGWAVQMAIDNDKDVYLFDQKTNFWHKYIKEYKKFLAIYIIPTLTENFAGIGTRELKENGKRAIEEIYKDNFKE